MIQTLVKDNSGVLTGPLYMILAGAMFAGANTAVQAAGMLHGVASQTVAFWQYAVALAVATPMVWRSRWTTKRLGLHTSRVIFAAIGVQLWVAGLAEVPIWQAIALILMSPIFVTAGAAFLLGERLTSVRIGAVFAGAFGGLLILAPWEDGFTFAAFLPVAAAVFWAAATLVTKRLTTTEPAATLTFYLLVLLVPINGIVATTAGFDIAAAAMGSVALAGLLTAGAQFALARAYVVADAAYLQPFDHLKLPMNVALGLVVFGFAPPGLMWLGAAIIIGASAIAIRDEIG